MKKIKLITLLIMYFAIPLFVNAIEKPTNSYKIIISNKNGAEIYEWVEENGKYKYQKTREKLNYNEVYTVKYEDIYNKEVYIYLATSPEDTYDDLKTIKFKDVKMYDITIEDYKHEEKMKYFVFDDNCYLYNGPSEKYGKISPETALNKETIVETEYYDSLWAYVEYNGQKGWIYTYKAGNPTIDISSGVVEINKESDNISIKTIKEVIMYKSPTSNEKLDIIIPKEEKIKTIYSYYTLGTASYYVEYQGQKGWIKSVAEDNIMTNIAYEHENNPHLIVKDEKGIVLYNEINNKNTEIDIIPYEAKIKSIYYLLNESGYISDWFFIEYNGKKGWVKGEVGVSLEYEENIEEEDGFVDLENNNGNQEISTNKKIIYYAVGATILSLTAAVTIILIKKKKKKFELKD